MPLLSQSEKEVRRMQRSMGIGVADSQPGKKEMNDGQQQLAVIDGVVTDVKKVNDELYHNRIFKSFEEEAETILNEESVIKVQHKFTGNPVFDPGFQSDTFSSGFAGSGYRINKDVASSFSSPNTAYNIEIDNMTVRGTLSVYELLIQQIRATNGAIFVTSAAKVSSASGLSASDDDGTITFDDPSGKSLCPFADGDIIMMQRVDPGATVSQSAAGDADGVVKKLVYKVNGAPSGATITVENAGFDNLSYPIEGDEFVRIGNDGTTSNRDGVIYLTSDDSNAPYIDIKSDIDTYAKWYGNVPEVRLGNLSGITYDSTSLSGYGLYSENVYLTGKMTATSGYIGNGSSGFTINNTYIGNGKTSLGDSNAGVYVGTNGISLGASSVFKVTSAGELTAANATITGTVNASGGNFTGYVTAANMKIGANVSGSNDGIFIDANDYWYDSGNFSLGNGNLTWNGSTLSITGAVTLTNTISSSDISDVNAYATNQDKQKLSTLNDDSPSGTGLFMDSSKLGYYDSTTWKTYMDNTGKFYLGGTSGALQWDGSTLTVTGNINISNASGVRSTLNVEDGASADQTDAEIRSGTGWSHSLDTTKIDGGDI